MVYTKANSEELDSKPTLILSVSHIHPESASLPEDIERASEFMLHGDGRSAMGLQLARRALLLSGGSITCRPMEGGTPGRIFEFAFRNV